MTDGRAASLLPLWGPGEGYDEPDVAVAARGDRLHVVSTDDARRARRAHPDRLSDVADLIRTAGDHAGRLGALLTEAALLLDDKE